MSIEIFLKKNLYKCVDNGEFKKGLDKIMSYVDEDEKNDFSGMSEFFCRDSKEGEE